MTNPVRTILNQKITITNEHEIFVEVLSNADEIDGNYVLCVPGVGLGISDMKPWADNLLARLPDTHIILMDPLNCGRSDSSKHPFNDFTVNNFAEILAQTVEAIQQKLNISTLELHVMGSAFGGVLTILLPTIRHHWVSDPIAIHLKSLITLATPISWQAILQSLDIIKEKYASDPKCSTYLETLDKLYKGNIGLNDYQKTMMTLAPVYTKRYENLSSSFLNNILINHPQWSTTFLDLFKPLSRQANLMHQALTGCSVEVMNSFYSRQFNKYNLQEIVEFNDAVFANLQVCMISGIEDPFAAPLTNAQIIAPLIPNTLQVELNAKFGLIIDGLVPFVSEIIAKLIQRNEEFLFKPELLKSPLIADIRGKIICEETYDDFILS